MTSDNRLGAASVAAIQQYLRLAETEGADVAGLCESVGLSPAIAGDPSAQVPGEVFQQLIRQMINTLGDPILGLRSGDFVQPGSYSVLGYITMSCATLGEAIARIAPYERLVGDMGVTGLSQSGDSMLLTWHCGYTDAAVRHHMIDNVFASWINYARWLGNVEDVSPLWVDLEHSSPGTLWEAAYGERWRCPVRFSQKTNRICIPKSLLQHPLRTPDPLLRQTLEDHAHSRLAALGAEKGFSTRVRSAIHQQLRAGITRQDMVAEQFSMTVRTLQRRLNSEGHSYQSLLDEVRREMACDYLQRTTLPFPDIALRLGFSDVRSFHRSFKTWTGVTPGSYRKVDGKD
ncbi:AraC family transcriptional regulator ligand-binding domain-containing protein [Hydrocarboniclastica marina]|uniref:Helix-turn-helix domain-containing protein n=1 Tax=Hydrocarboniclastica marina TaxID=2259620 RepID=A0A4P7XJE5_9ALTE|nr:AraC family transcriptional regulator ligand-binding domain-containing protein [Hydrocarboniclastica marina]QCF25987.1 helix-turn-helix domain-containing protein [Hydrocarboniclastica marina]